MRSGTRNIQPSPYRICSLLLPEACTFTGREDDTLVSEVLLNIRGSGADIGVWVFMYTSYSITTLASIWCTRSTLSTTLTVILEEYMGNEP